MVDDEGLKMITRSKILILLRNRRDMIEILPNI